MGKDDNLSKKMIQFNKKKISADKIKIKENTNCNEIIEEDKCLKRVLIVDDSSYNLIVMKEIIGVIQGRLGVEYQIKTALNGQEALEVIQENIDQVNKKIKFDCLFIDLQMPVLDGY